jgi:hypothetical protein
MEEVELQTPEIVDLASVALADLIVLEHQKQLKMKKNNLSSSSSSSSSYSFSNDLMETVNPTVVPSSSSSPVVLQMVTAQVARGSKQVVAGMNYNLTIVVVAQNISTTATTSTTTTAAAASSSIVVQAPDQDQDEDSNSSSNNSLVVVCMGAFECTIYDHFGERSVTKWGKEVSCQDTAVVERMQWYQEQVHHDHSKEDDATVDITEGTATSTTSTTSTLQEEDTSSDDGNGN